MTSFGLALLVVAVLSPYNVYVDNASGQGAQEETTEEEKIQACQTIFIYC